MSSPSAVQVTHPAAASTTPTKPSFYQAKRVQMGLEKPDANYTAYQQMQARNVLSTMKSAADFVKGVAGKIKDNFVQEITHPNPVPASEAAPSNSETVDEYLARIKQERSSRMPDWLNDAYGAIDKFMYKNPVGRQLTGFSQGAMTALTGLQPEANDDFTVGSKASHVTGSLASVAVNPAAPETSLVQGGYKVAEGALATKAGQKAVQGTAKAIEKTGVSVGTANTVAQNLVRGAIAGSTQNVAQMAAAGQTSPRQIAENAAIGGVLGGAGDAGAGLIHTGIANILSRYRSKAANPETIDKILALPEPRSRGNENAAETPDVINVPETEPRGLPEPSPEDATRARNMDAAKVEISSIDDELNALESRYQQAINDQYKFLKQSMASRGGVDQGALIRDEAGEVVNRVGRTSNNPEWYQEFFRQTGRAPTNKELYDLAKQHVDNGFVDGGVQVPSWRSENGYDETVDALNQVKQRLGRVVNGDSKEPIDLSELLRSRGLDETPENIAQVYNTKNWYHGTGKSDLKAEELDPFVGNHESLFGQGVYLTDSPTIADGYAKSRGKRTNTPTVYESNIKVNRVLDLEKPVTSDVAAALDKTAKQLDYQYQQEFDDSNHFTNLIQSAVNKGDTPEQIITALRKEIENFSHKAEIPTSEFVENFQDLAINLKQAGYDGITHTGGGRTGHDPHRVLILLDPQNWYGGVEGSQTVTKFDKYTPRPKEAYFPAAAPQTVPARAPGIEPIPREPKASSGSGEQAATRAADIDALMQEYSAADAALAELDRRYSAGDSPAPEDVQQMIELEGRKAAAASQIQQAMKAGSIPEDVKARVSAASEAPSLPSTGSAERIMTPEVGSAAAAATPEGVSARVTPPSGPRNAGPAKPTTSKTISRAKLIENIRKNLGVTISSGRTGYDRNKVLGIHKTQSEVIRTGFAEDYDTIAHEVGHNFTKRFGIDDPAYLKELTDMMDTMGVHNYREDYQPNQWLDEGIAEYMRAYLTQPDTARQLAPRFTQFLESKLPVKIQRGIANVQRDIAIWEGQGDYNRAVGKVDFDGGSNQTRASWDKWYTRSVDDLNPIKLAEKALTGAVNIGSKSIYKLARLSRGVGERAKMAITRGIFDDQGKRLSDGLRKIVAPLEKIGMTEKDFGTYLAVVHAEDLKGLEKIIPFSDEEILAVKMKWGNNPVVQKAQKEVVKYNNALLDLMVDAQLLSQKAVAEMRRKYPNYVPFMRYFDDDAVAGFKGGGYGSAKGFANITNPVKRMTEEGSDRTVINPIESMVKNTFLVMNAAAKNKVGLRLADLSKIDGAGAWVEHVPGASDPKEHIVNVKIDGENQAFKIRDPELYNAMLSLDNESVNSLIKFLGGSASLLRSGATLTPEFMIRNVFRDVSGAMINSTKYGFTPVDFFKGFFHVITKSETFEKFINSGGAMSTMMGLDRDTNREALEAVFRLSLKDKAMNVVTSPKELAKFLSGYTPLKATVGVLRKGAEISELSTKVGAFNKALQKTGDLDEAAYTARDLMDFNRAGSAVRQANRAIAFLNASIQGTDRMARAFKDNPASFLTRAFTTLVLPASLAYYWNQNFLSDEEKKTFDNIPQWQKDSFYVIGIPGTGEFIRIPKPFEAGMLFATSTERMLDWIEGNDKQAFDGYGKATLEALTPPVMFTALSPLLEAITNHSFFRNAPVIPQGEQRLEKKDQYGVYTSELAKEIGQFMDKIGLGDTNAASPRIIDNTIKGYTAGLGQYGVDLVDKGIESIRGSDGVADPAKKWTEDPFFRSFFVSTSGGGQVRDEFYNKWDKLSAAKASASRNEEEFKQQKEYDHFNFYYKQITKWNKQYKEIQKSTELSAEEKRSKLDELDAKMNEAASAALGK